MNEQITLLEEKIKELEGHLKLTQQIGKLGTWEIDLKTLKATWTDEIYEIFGRPNGSLEPTVESYLTTVYPDDKNHVFQEFNKSEKTKQPFDIHHRIILPDGTVKHLVLKGRFVMDITNKPFKLTGVVLDVTERIKYENDLNVAKEKAEESNKLKSNFLQNMSHEIRTPMNGVMGFCQLLIKKDDIPQEKQKQYLQTIYNSCKTLLTVINDILDISKIDVGIIQVHYNEFNINTFIDEIFEQFKPEANKNKISLSTSKELSNEASAIISDKLLLHKVLSNLLNNAIKFTPEGNIKFGYTVKENELLFTVKDTGIGIDSNHKDTIFERFSQIDSNMNRKFGGTGLGLAISKSIVSLMGGKIWFDSELGKGSTFYFSVPFIMNAEESKKLKLSEKELNSENLPIILVAEDDDSNYLLISEILMDTNAKIVRAINGKNAVEKIKKQNYNLVFMDIKMPEMDGLEATREVRTFNTKIPIIAVSAISFPEERKSSMDAGCNDYITKPYDIQVISKIIDKYLG